MCAASPRQAEVPGWRPGQGWGWIWGEQDEIGALNAITPKSIVEALRSVQTGAVYDLGVTIDRNSFLAPPHVGTELVTFRSPEGIKRQRDLIGLDQDRHGVSFHTSMVILSDHAGTQLDGLCHATFGEDHHWYNGFTVEQWSGDFGPRRAAAHGMPPVIAQGVLIDVAGHLGVDELAAGFPVGPDLLAETLAAQGTELAPGEVVLIRTGTLRHWGHDGSNRAALAGPDTAGISLAAAKWLCEDKGALLVGSDTSTVEVVPSVDGDNESPVHKYLLVDQGVHMGELHYLEKLAAEAVHRFAYLALSPKVRGATAGFALRPIALV
jgi:kynurenine formamidase